MVVNLGQDYFNFSSQHFFFSLSHSIHLNADMHVKFVNNTKYQSTYILKQIKSQVQQKKSNEKDMFGSFLGHSNALSMKKKWFLLFWWCIENMKMIVSLLNGLDLKTEENSSIFLLVVHASRRKWWPISISIGFFRFYYFQFSCVCMTIMGKVGSSTVASLHYLFGRFQMRIQTISSKPCLHFTKIAFSIEFFVVIFEYLSWILPWHLKDDFFVQTHNEKSREVCDNNGEVTVNGECDKRLTPWE